MNKRWAGDTPTRDAAPLELCRSNPKLDPYHSKSWKQSCEAPEIPNFQIIPALGFLGFLGGMSLPRVQQPVWPTCTTAIWYSWQVLWQVLWQVRQISSGAPLLSSERCDSYDIMADHLSPCLHSAECSTDHWHHTILQPPHLRKKIWSKMCCNSCGAPFIFDKISISGQFCWKFGQKKRYPSQVHHSRTALQVTCKKPGEPW